jgi:hypothetical protein
VLFKYKETFFQATIKEYINKHYFNFRYDSNKFVVIAHLWKKVMRIIFLPSVFFESFPTLEWSFLSVLFLPSWKSPKSNKHDKQYIYTAEGKL